MDLTCGPPESDECVQYWNNNQIYSLNGHGIDPENIWDKSMWKFDVVMDATWDTNFIFKAVRLSDMGEIIEVREEKEVVKLCIITNR